MPEIEVIDGSRHVVGRLELAGDVFDAQSRPHLVTEVVTWQRARRRRGTASTKNRAVVHGSGVKPWRQKGTGRARAGTRTSPLWRHGGIIFGPTPRDYSYTLPKKVRRGALCSVLSDKLRAGEVVVVDSMQVSQPRTKAFLGFLHGLGLVGETVLLILSGPDRNVELGSRNLSEVKVLRAEGVNVYDLLRYRKAVFTKEALAQVERRLIGEESA